MSQLDKPRPPSLDIEAANNADVALRIVSPALPKLSSEMKLTMKMSNKIHMQQKSLIAQRRGQMADDADADEDADAHAASDPITPRTASSLKRNHIPAPLDMSETQAPPPAIHSAPIRYSRMVRTTPHKSYMHLPPHRSYSPYGTQFKRMRSSPVVYRRYQQYTPQSARPHTAAPKVTDVFGDNLVRGAPLASQPLSAQRDYFFEEDRLPVSEDERREMEAKHNQTEVFGSVNLMNESVFKFRIFGDADDRTKDKFLEICSKTWDQFAGARAD